MQSQPVCVEKGHCKAQACRLDKVGHAAEGRPEGSRVTGCGPWAGRLADCGKDFYKRSLFLFSHLPREGRRGTLGVRHETLISASRNVNRRGT